MSAAFQTGTKMSKAVPNQLTFMFSSAPPEAGRSAVDGAHAEAVLATPALPPPTPALGQTDVDKQGPASVRQAVATLAGLNGNANEVPLSGQKGGLANSPACIARDGSAQAPSVGNTGRQRRKRSTPPLPSTNISGGPLPQVTHDQTQAVVQDKDLQGATAPPPQIQDVPANLAMVVEQLRSITSLSPRALADMKSAVVTVGRVTGKPLNEIAADPAQLREIFENTSPAMAGITINRWTRVRSLLLGALRAVGIEVMKGRAVGDLSPAWAKLFALLPDERCRRGLSRLLHYLTDQGIEPADAGADSLTQFYNATMTTSLRADPKWAFNTTCRCWNIAINRVPGWPAVPMPAQPDKRKYALKWEEFPARFQEEVDRYLNHAGTNNPFATDYTSPVKSSTLALRRGAILQLASALVASGMPADRITGLDVLVDPKNAEAALGHLLDRNNGKMTAYLSQQAQLLGTIAKHWVKANERSVKTLRGFASGLAPPRQGMVERNRARLRQFDLPANMDALLLLPYRVLQDVKKNDTGKREAALRVMFAVAVEILSVAPMRVENLCGLEIDRHIVETRHGRTRTRHIVIPAGETKTKVPFEKQLSPECCALLDTYISTYRTRVSATPGPWLFPGKDGGRRATTRFSTALAEFIFRHTGIRMHTHLFRHLSGKLQLQHNPASIETVRQILGHRSSATTLRFYAETRTDEALRRYQDTISKLREKARARLAATPDNREPGVRP
jgi:integrase